MEELDRIARSQWGLITHAQVLTIASRRQLDALLKRKRLLPLHRGVYRTAGAPQSWQQQIVAAQLSLCSEAVASHQSAARLLSLSVPYVPVPHLTIPLGRPHQRAHIEIHRSTVPDAHIVFAQKIMCTSVERTFIDLAGTLPRRMLAYGLDEAVIAGKTTYGRVDGVVREMGSRGRKGVAALRALLDERLVLPDDVTSKIHRKVLAAARKAGVPEPVVEYGVTTRLGKYYMDVAWPDLKVGAEADGYNIHTASRVRHTKDRRRRNELETLGWRVLNFTHDMPVDEIADVLGANLCGRLAG